ncbi:uncharacterized protein LOC127987172 [Carassius gibelio]|uniref:uncharacterized protein LOC127987172 n=1 Tax=Carassius gibelio TaxID=101364 RepID=UPI002277A701|nr:uncharacterized protein LOC127987172 [Carassius gibelio]
MARRFILLLLFNGVSSIDTDKVTVSVMEGDSVTLHTGVKANQQEMIVWFFNNTRTAKISGDQSKICADVQCKEGTERNRLKMDDQTGSLTITNITITDCGLYKLVILNGTSRSKIFHVAVHAVPDKIEKKSVKAGNSVTLESLDCGVVKHPYRMMRWYFKDSLIIEITGNQSEICSDDECKERFRDRLKLDNQTESLTITDIRTTDSGDYKLQIRSSNSIGHRHRRSISITSVKSFSVTVTGHSRAVVARICAPVITVFLLLVLVAYAIRKSKIYRLT